MKSRALVLFMLSLGMFPGQTMAMYYAAPKIDWGYWGYCWTKIKASWSKVKERGPLNLLLTSPEYESADEQEKDNLVTAATNSANGAQAKPDDSDLGIPEFREFNDDQSKDPQNPAQNVPPVPPPANTHAQSSPPPSTASQSLALPPSSKSALWTIGAGAATVIGLGLAYEFIKWGGYSPVLRDVRIMEEMIKFADQEQLKSIRFETMAAHLTYVPVEEIAEMRRLVTAPLKEGNFTHYMAYTVIEHLYQEHARVDLVHRLTYGYSKRLEQVNGLVSKVWNWFSGDQE